MFRHLPLVALLVSAPAFAADRVVQIASFERLRVEGPFQVTVATGRPPRAVVSGDARALERVEVRQDGKTLVVRRALGQSGADTGASAPLTVTLGTGTLAGASVVGGGALAITGARAQRLDLSVAGAGSIAFAGADADQANATVIGTGRITLAGRAVRARLLVNGAGRIDADKLETDELTVLVEGPGETSARARYTASVTNMGLGQVSVTGNAKCTVKNPAGGAVICGATAR